MVVEKIAHDFTTNWRGVIDKINSDVLKYFSNFKNGSEILKQALNQLATYYSKFEDAVKKHFKNATFRKDVVTISTIRYEMQKHLSHSF